MCPGARCRCDGRAGQMRRSALSIAEAERLTYRGQLATGIYRKRRSLRLVGRIGGAALAVGTWCGCDGIQSALEPAGREAEQLADLFWWMAAGTLVIWLAVLGLAVYSVRVDPERGKRRENLFIITFGAVVPTVVLTGLLAYGLAILPGQVALAPEGALKISVDGELWWWRVHYETPGGNSVQLANEVRMPVGQPVQFELRSSNVIHSFWIPSIGGKKDMIPGRINRLALTPTKTGTYRGICAEYCGTSHALMGFFAVVLEQDEFSAWLNRQMQDAPEPANELATRGRELFMANGCGACHAIRGTSATGAIGPDLTHVGSRLSIGAGTLPTTRNNLVKWIGRVHQVKPGVLMPHFGMLQEEDLQAIAAYLEGLK